MGTSMYGDNCLVIHDHNRPLNVFNYDPKDGHECVRIVNAEDPHSGQKYILMIDQAIQISDVDNHLLGPMQCHLNGLQVSEIPKLLTDCSRETILILYRSVILSMLPTHFYSPYSYRVYQLFSYTFPKN